MIKYIFQEVKHGETCWTQVNLWGFPLAFTDFEEAKTVKAKYAAYLKSLKQINKLRLLEVSEKVVE